MLNYITENYVWLSTFIGLEISFFVINYLLLTMKNQTFLNPIVTIVETTIMIAAIIYTGAPMWLVLTIVSLTAVSICTMFALKLKYSL